MTYLWWNLVSLDLVCALPLYLSTATTLTARLLAAKLSPVGIRLVFRSVHDYLVKNGMLQAEIGISTLAWLAWLAGLATLRTAMRSLEV